MARLGSSGLVRCPRPAPQASGALAPPQQRDGVVASSSCAATHAGRLAGPAAPLSLHSHPVSGHLFKGGRWEDGFLGAFSGVVVLRPSLGSLPAGLWLVFLKISGRLIAFASVFLWQWLNLKVRFNGEDDRETRLKIKKRPCRILPVCGNKSLLWQHSHVSTAIVCTLALGFTWSVSIFCSEDAKNL